MSRPTIEKRKGIWCLIADGKVIPFGNDMHMGEHYAQKALEQYDKWGTQDLFEYVGGNL